MQRGRFRRVCCVLPKEVSASVKIIRAGHRPSPPVGYRNRIVPEKRHDRKAVHTSVFKQPGPTKSIGSCACGPLFLCPSRILSSVTRLERRSPSAFFTDKAGANLVIADRFRLGGRRAMHKRSLRYFIVGCEALLALFALMAFVAGVNVFIYFSRLPGVGIQRLIHVRTGGLILVELVATAIFGTWFGRLAVRNFRDTRAKADRKEAASLSILR